MEISVIKKGPSLSVIGVNLSNRKTKRDNTIISEIQPNVRQ